jgi:small GTP-binding protein
MVDGPPTLAFKAVMVGDSGVGKTALITRWTTGAFSHLSAPTIGANHHRKRVIVQNDAIDVFLWDTAGQEEFLALTPLYARGASVAILTTCIDEPNSFTNLDRWKKLVGSSGDVIPPIILAVNKMDLSASARINIEEIHDQYEGQFAGIFGVSAVTNEGVDNLFMFAAVEGYRFTKVSVDSRAKTILDEEEVTNGGCC